MKEISKEEILDEEKLFEAMDEAERLDEEMERKFHLKKSNNGK
jgi:hypothetical protein